METSLHRQLKEQFAVQPDAVEVQVDGYRIDAIDAEGALVEIQHASLSALRSKVQCLLEAGHRVRIIKPILICKTIETLASRTGPVLRRRRSPKAARHRDVFRELIHFTAVFPHPRLTLELVSVHTLEQRLDRTTRSWRRKAYEVVDQHLVSIGEQVCLASSRDLWTLLGAPKLAQPFDTAELGVALGEARWFAQQIAYVLHRCGAIEAQGKRGNAILYRMDRRTKTPRPRRSS
ncbi:MAG: hypothetical protein ACK5OB_19160 [Pirellula sp.]|jgi:hypothetical protein